jgi:beta-glucosidase
MLYSSEPFLRSTFLGRLPITFYRDSYLNLVNPLSDFNLMTGPNNATGRTYRYAQHIPPTAIAYPFGYGLTYTTFHYADLKLTGSVDSNVRVTVTVTNEGQVDGHEVVQLYVSVPSLSEQVCSGPDGNQFLFITNLHGNYLPLHMFV